MNKISRLEIAQNTLKIIENGCYLFEGKEVNVKQKIKDNIEKTVTIAPHDWDKILSKPIFEYSQNVTIEVINSTSIEALFAIKNQKVGILNFASAKNPGGGFLGGASAQEESLARSSSLYASLMKDQTMYKYNRNQTSFLYSDYMIYSPKTVFWFDDNGNAMEESILIDVITSPAPNKGAMLQHNRTEEIALIEEVFLKRIRYVLHLANQVGIEYLILGAWGCGVFRNESSEVAKLFQKVIEEEYSKAFKKIVFAVFDTSEKQLNFKAFEKII